MRPMVCRHPIFVACIVAAWIALGPTTAAQEPVRPQPSKELIRALEDMREMEQELLALQRMPPEERYREAQDLRRELERLLDRVTGTRWENQAVYWLADWHFGYGDPDEVVRLVGRLSTLQRPAYQAAGRAMLARVLVSQGRIDEARPLAEALVAYAPEFQPVLDMIEFHARIGRPAPKTSGRALQGTGHPLRDRFDPWQLYYFASLGDPHQRHQFERLLGELQREEYPGRVHLVLVAFDGDPLGTLSHVAGMEGGEEVDVLWANPNEGGDAAAWRSLWDLPELPISVLLTREGEVMAVAPGFDRLRPLAGLESDDGDDGAAADTWRLHRRGRYAD